MPHRRCWPAAYCASRLAPRRWARGMNTRFPSGRIEGFPACRHRLAVDVRSLPLCCDINMGHVHSGQGSSAYVRALDKKQTGTRFAPAPLGVVPVLLSVCFRLFASSFLVHSKFDGQGRARCIKIFFRSDLPRGGRFYGLTAMCWVWRAPRTVSKKKDEYKRKEDAHRGPSRQTFGRYGDPPDRLPAKDRKK